MSDLLELFSRDPLSYTNEAGEVQTIIAKLRDDWHGPCRLPGGFMEPTCRGKHDYVDATRKDLSHYCWCALRLTPCRAPFDDDRATFDPAEIA